MSGKGDEQGHYKPDAHQDHAETSFPQQANSGCAEEQASEASYECLDCVSLRCLNTENRLSKCSGRPLGLCGRRLPELNLIPIQVIDPGKATVGFIPSFGVNLYSLLF